MTKHILLLCILGVHVIFNIDLWSFVSSIAEWYRDGVDVMSQNVHEVGKVKKWRGKNSHENIIIYKTTNSSRHSTG